jgi:hypothetical protein
MRVGTTTDNGILDKGAAALADGLAGNLVLEELRVSSCGIGPPGASALAAALVATPACVLGVLMIDRACALCRSSGMTALVADCC